MSNKQLSIFILFLVIIILITIYQTNTRLDRIQLATSQQSKLLQVHTTFQTSITIDKVEGNGHVFGDNNKIENKTA